MAKITRATQKQFGSGAGTNELAKYGSLAAGSPVRYSGATVTPANIQALTNFLTGWSGAVIGGNSPAIEDMNSLCYLFAYQLGYILQQGIPEWDSGTTYYTDSYCQYNGVVVKSLDDSNTNNTPSISAATAHWTPQFLVKANNAALGQQVSSSCGNFSTGSTSNVDVTNLTVTLTTVGHPVLISLQPDGSGNSFIGAQAASNTGVVSLYLLRGASIIAAWQLGEQITGASAVNVQWPSTLTFLDTGASAGSNVYKLQGNVLTGTTLTVFDAKLVAYEL